MPTIPLDKENDSTNKEVPSEGDETSCTNCKSTTDETAPRHFSKVIDELGKNDLGLMVPLSVKELIVEKQAELLKMHEELISSPRSQRKIKSPLRAQITTLENEVEELIREKRGIRDVSTPPLSPVNVEG